MSKYLCTFSGKFGDILWSLPTVRLISKIVGEPVNFATMPAYSSLKPLLAEQPYIDEPFVVQDWHCLHSNHGDQPWHTPDHVVKGYEKFWHLGYRGHPGINDKALALIDFVAYQQGFSFREKPIPFLHVPDAPKWGGVAYAFNKQYESQKQAFLIGLCRELPHVQFVNVSVMPWVVATQTIKNALCFVGCRSANYVLAHGVGQRVVCFEPHPARNQVGYLGKIFGCPYGEEYGLAYNIPLATHVAYAAGLIKQWKVDYEKEHKNVAITA